MVSILPYAVAVNTNSPCQTKIVHRPGHRSYLEYMKHMSKNRPWSLKGRKIKPKVGIQKGVLFISLNSIKNSCPQIDRRMFFSLRHWWSPLLLSDFPSLWQDCAQLLKYRGFKLSIPCMKMKSFVTTNSSMQAPQLDQFTITAIAKQVDIGLNSMVSNHGQVEISMQIKICSSYQISTVPLAFNFHSCSCEHQ